MELHDMRVGMKLRVVHKSAGAEVGDIVTVRNIESHDFRYWVPSGDDWWWGSASHFEPECLVPAPTVAAATSLGQAGGLKYDGGKAPWSLLLSAKGMIAAVGGVVGVLAFGAKKYDAHSWRGVEDNERRYTDALIRHLVAIQTHGLTARDEESGELHIDHLNCNGLFLGELARK